MGASPLELMMRTYPQMLYVQVKTTNELLYPKVHPSGTLPLPTPALLAEWEEAVGTWPWTVPEEAG